MGKKILFIIIIATILIGGCKKNNAGNQASSIEIKYSAEGLAYVQLPLNKYFIYKDSATGTLDSVVVTQSNLEKLFSPKHTSSGPSDPETPDFYYQTFTLTLTNYKGTLQRDWFYGYATNVLSLYFLNSTTNASIFLKEKDRVNNDDKNYVFNYPFVPSQISNISVNIFPSITIEGKTYLDAVAFITTNDVSPTLSNYLKSTYYWVKGVGIIKREIRTSNSVKTELLVKNG